MAVNCLQRTETAVPLQSLAALNSDFVRLRSRSLAQRILEIKTGHGNELERGNIVRWQATVDDYLRGKEMPVEVRMDNQSILALTLRIVLLSVAFVLGGILLALTLLHRKGVRQLRAES